MSVSFKITLQAKEEEIRRFQVDRELATSLTCFKNKLVSIFPILGGREFTLTWQDEEGDEVSIVTEEDLVLALTELKGPVYKLRVKMTGQQRREGEKKEQQKEGVHAGVVCDGCEGAVAGHRYKCLHCQDFDLCSGCEGRGLHSLHRMVRIPAPPATTTCRRQGTGTLSRCPITRTRGCRVGPQLLSGGCTNPTFNILLQEMAAARQEKPGQKEGKSEDVKQGAPGNKKETPETPAATDVQEQLQQVGSLLVSVFGPGLAAAALTILEAVIQPENKKSEDADEKKNDTVQKDKEKNDGVSEVEKEKTTVQSEHLKEKSNEDSEAEFEIIPKTSSTTLYPALPAEEQSRLWKTTLTTEEMTEENKSEEDNTKSVKIDSKEDPSVSAALATMKAMGFTDEGGWLSTLLQAKRGDVASVLDIIQPGK